MQTIAIAVGFAIGYILILVPLVLGAMATLAIFQILNDDKKKELSREQKSRGGSVMPPHGWN
jgi:Ca2+/Na+ antiporter